MAVGDVTTGAALSTTFELDCGNGNGLRLRSDDANCSLFLQDGGSSSGSHVRLRAVSDELQLIANNNDRVHIESNADFSALDTTGAVLLPSLTTTQRNALTAINGMVIYNTTTGAVEAREGGAWVNL